MSTVNKVTKKTQYNTILKLLSDAEGSNYPLPDGITFDDLKDFVNHEVELLDNKAAAAAKRAQNKKEAGDELRERVFNTLTGDYQTIPEIVAALGDPDATAQKITSRLTQLVSLGRAEKDSVSVPTSEGKTRKVSAYRVV